MSRTACGVSGLLTSALLWILPLHGEAQECLRLPPPHRLLMQALLSRTPTGARGTFIRWQGVTIRAERECQHRQMLPKLIKWVRTTTLFQEGQSYAVPAGTPGRSEAPMRAAAQRHRDEAEDSIHLFQFFLIGLTFKSLSRNIKFRLGEDKQEKYISYVFISLCDSNLSLTSQCCSLILK